MGRRASRVLAVAVVAVLVAVSVALAASSVTKVHLQAGNLLVIGEGGVSPSGLPKTVDAPVRIFGRGGLGTADGSLPPILKTIEFEFDRHGSIQTLGLPVSTPGRLQSTKGPQAPKLSPGPVGRE